MGTYGTGIFADDTAALVRDSFLEQLAETGEPDTATAQILVQLKSLLGDEEDAGTIWLALAATQCEYGCLDATVRDQALSVIDTGRDLKRWDGSPAQGRRAAVLAALRTRLLGPSRRFRRPRVRRHAEPKATKLPSPDGKATATVWDISSNGAQAQVFVEMLAEVGWGGGHVAILLCSWEAVALKWADSNTLEIAYPTGAALRDAKDKAFFAGRTLAVRYCAT